MIAKGKIRADGAKLARYLMTGEKGEIAQLVETRALEAFGNDPAMAFGVLEQVADANTKCTKAFFHGHVRLAAGERLSDAQWMETVDRMEKRLGFTDQPRIVSFHLDEASGDKHLHVGWFRVDLETMRAIDPGMYKNHLKQLSRTLEKDLALREVSNHRQPQDRARAADRNEFEQSRRLGTDGRAIRTSILECLEQSDSGKAFKAAMEEKSFILANGDRRDCFVVIDQAGGQHALNKKLTGQTLAQTRERFADLDRAQLPGVEQAQEIQVQRHAARGSQEAERPRAAGREGEQGATRGPYTSLEPGEVQKVRSLGKTAGEVRLAWNLTNTAAQFTQQLTEQGLILVYVSREEAQANERAREFAKAIGRQSRPMREGFCVVDSRGAVTRIDQRATGEQWEVIEKRLGGIDRAELMSVAEAREQMRSANRAAWQAQKQAERAQARKDGPVTGQAAEIRNIWQQSRNEQHLEEELAARGMTLAQATADEARRSERVAALAKEARRFAPVFKEGEIVVVNSWGNIFHLDERTTGELRPEIDAKLSSIDRSTLLSAADAQAAMKEASRAAWADAREQMRPASWIENRIADCAKETPFTAVMDAEGRTVSEVAALADRFRADGEGVLEAREISGGEAFAGRLEGAGIAIARVTASDRFALEALRHDEAMRRITAETNRETYQGSRFADVEAGELAAVTRNGDVYRLNSAKLGDAAQYVATDLPSVTEARARFEIEREEKSELYAARNAETVAARETSAEAREQHAENAQTARDTREMLGDIEGAAERGVKTTGKALAVAAKVFETGFNLVFGWAMAGPKLTLQQTKDNARAESNEETQHAHAFAAMTRAEEQDFDWRQHAQKTAQQEQDLSLSARFKTPPTREANIGRDRDDDYERERER